MDQEYDYTTKDAKGRRVLHRPTPSNDQEDCENDHQEQIETYEIEPEIGHFPTQQSVDEAYTVSNYERSHITHAEVTRAQNNRYLNVKNGTVVENTSNNESALFTEPSYDDRLTTTTDTQYYNQHPSRGTNGPQVDEDSSSQNINRSKPENRPYYNVKPAHSATYENRSNYLYMKGSTKSTRLEIVEKPATLPRPTKHKMGLAHTQKDYEIVDVPHQSPTGVQNYDVEQQDEYEIVNKPPPRPRKTHQEDIQQQQSYEIVDTPPPRPRKSHDPEETPSSNTHTEASSKKPASHKQSKGFHNPGLSVNEEEYSDAQEPMSIFQGFPQQVNRLPDYREENKPNTPTTPTYDVKKDVPLPMTVKPNVSRSKARRLWIARNFNPSNGPRAQRNIAIAVVIILVIVLVIILASVLSRHK